LGDLVERRFCDRRLRRYPQVEDVLRQ
jgi:hypothetical protein